MKIQLNLMRRAALPLLLMALFSTIQPVSAQGTAFTYQGRLTTNGAPYSGSADFQFTLWDSATTGSALATNNPVSVIAPVSDGLFTVTLDFGMNPFSGEQRFLQTDVRTAIGPFTTLTPRQAVTATPYAFRAFNLTTNGLAAGAYGNAVTFNNAGNTFAGTFTGAANGNGAGLTNVNAAALGGLASSNYWQLGGNTVASNQFLGSINFEPVDFRVGNLRVLRLDFLDAGSLNNVSPSVIGGHWANIAMSSNGFARGATISGGGSLLYPNVISNNTAFATISGGIGNAVSNWVNYATIGGGQFNQAAASEATVAGGAFNKASGFSSAIGGGGGHQAAGSWSTVPGGRDNSADADYSLAAGRQASASHAGSFVWADSQGADFNSQGVNTFNIRANGGVRLNEDTSIYFGSQVRQMLNLWGAQYGIGVQGGTAYFRTASRFSWFSGGQHSDTQNDPGSGGTLLMTLNSGGLTVNGTFVSASDRNVKENFTPVNPGEVLDKVAALPISRWSYKADADVPHLGPMAQDFYAAFAVGPDDKHIATVDADGVALAAIQGLNEKVEVGRRKAEDRIQKLESENANLKARLGKLEQLLNQKTETAQ